MHELLEADAYCTSKACYETASDPEIHMLDSKNILKKLGLNK